MSDQELYNPKGNFDIQNELGELIEEIEESTAIKTSIKNRIFNQPQLVTVSSANANPVGQNATQYNQTSYFAITSSFARPALDVESIQLISSNIPNIQTNIPDTACVFWYYRLSQYSGLTPCLNNLYMVRLLPSYYKPEWLNAIYGQNINFQNYTNLANQLTLITKNDIAYNNYQNIIWDNPNTLPTAYIPFIPNDISLTYNPTITRFQMTGNATSPAYLPFDSIRIYLTGDIIYYAPSGSPLKAYQSIQNGNVGNYPDISPTWWSIYSGEIIAPWNNSYYYTKGMYVVATTAPISGQPVTSIYQLTTSFSVNEFPPFSSSWEVYDGLPNWYYYLATGTEDPLVRQMQGDKFYIQWNPTTIYQVGATVQYNGFWYNCINPNVNVVPSSLSTNFWQDNHWVIGTNYNNGNIVLYNGIYYQSLVDGNIGNVPILPWNYQTSYTIGSTVTYNGIVYEALQNNTNKIPTNTSYWNPISSQVWQINNTPTSLYAPLSGLHYLSGQYDFVDYTAGGAHVIHYPFPEGISAQPFNPTPQRLLNSILGFCWNGDFSPDVITRFMTDYINSTDYGVIGITELSLFNRIRPLPLYTTINNGLGAGSGAIPYPTGISISDVMTYTADTYCNLLFSSVVSIYCDLLTSGSLDTQKTNNILAIAPLSSVLGLASFNNFIANPILRVMDHITEITIELYDEFGEPFWLPNSAVSTFVFKFTYKENKV